jgi:hypothetical protein
MNRRDGGLRLQLQPAPRRLRRKLMVVEVGVSSATVSRSCGGGASRVSYPT